ncbi:MAG: O-antigen ligase family protein [Chthonomonadaceae bacterium]|nr:O-antigen ligase family protein [Chthonomonadaceae bacterium]
MALPHTQLSQERERTVYNPPEQGLFSPHNIVLFLGGVLCLPAFLAYFLATSQETQAVAEILGVVGAIATLRNPFIGLIIFIGLLYTRPEDLLPQLEGMRLSLMASVLTLVTLLVYKMQNKEKGVKTPGNALMLTFGLLCVISTATSSGEPAVVAQEVGKLIILFFLVVNLVNTPARYHTFVSAMLTFTVYLAVYSLWLFLSGDGVKRGDIAQAQGSGIFGDPNDLSASIVAGIALCLTRIAQSKPLGKVFYIALSLFLMWATVLTNSRGGMLALMLVLGGFLIIYIPGKTTALMLSLVLGVGMLKFGPSRMSEMDASEESANSRFWFWDNGVTQLMSSPVTGVGYGRFESINGGMTAHNSYVLCFTELGIPGYFCWIGCLYYCFRRPYKKGQKSAFIPEDKPNIEDKPKRKMSSNGIIDRKKHIARLDHERIGPRLALAGFMMAAFWISRTYVPVLYLFISLPLAQAATYQKTDERPLPNPRELYLDYCKIAAIAIVSIVSIGVIAHKMK